MRILFVLALCVGCYGFDNEGDENGETGGAGGTTTTGGSGGSTGTPSDLPCDVANLLGMYCTSCHSSPPTGGAPVSLVSYADLTAPAVSDPTKKEADVCLSRMQSTTSPMPPAGSAAPSATEIAAFAAWIQSGYPMGSCSTGNNNYNTPVMCSSGIYWNGGSDGSSRMHPGRACNACHSMSGGEAPRFSIAGTVYPSAHEPDDCYGKSAISVVITGANGAIITLNSNSAGNFYSYASVATPYHAKVVSSAGERAMSAGQVSGDCNTCHTEGGSKSAPGRIMAP